jgi:hypothetical protein
VAVSDAILRRLERKAGIEGLVDALADRLEPHELTSLLLAVFDRRAAQTNAARVLQRYEQDAFVRPTAFAPAIVASAVAASFEAAIGFEPIELSPVCPLGTCTSVGPVSQGNIVSTARQTEVVSDVSNVLALEAAVRRRGRLREDPRDATRVKLCASQRVVRAQRVSGPAMFQHFQLFAAITAGRDTGNHRFEIDALVEHIGLHLRAFDRLRARGFAVPEDAAVRVELERPPECAWVDTVAERVRADHPRVHVDLGGRRDTAYYPDVSFGIEVGEHNLGDGGLVPWTAKLLSNEKERLCISGFGSERACALWPTSSPAAP